MHRKWLTLLFLGLVSCFYLPLQYIQKLSEMTVTTVNLTARYQLPVGALTMNVNNLFDQEVEINGNTNPDISLASLVVLWLQKLNFPHL